mgnify:CR=1 FL=1
MRKYRGGVLAFLSVAVITYVVARFIFAPMAETDLAEMVSRLFAAIGGLVGFVIWDIERR